MTGFFKWLAEWVASFKSEAVRSPRHRPLFLEGLEVRLVPAAPPLMDINTTPVAVGNPNTQGSNPSYLTPIPGGSTVFFSATSKDHDNELWRVQGTGLPSLVKDINTTAKPMGEIGTKGSNPEYLAYFTGNQPGPTVFFAATGVATKVVNGENVNYEDRELWKSDGTAAGTVLVKNINTDVTGVTGSSPRSLVVAGDYLFFVANDGVKGLELWRTDGTAAGTVLVKDIKPGADVEDGPTMLRSAGNNLLFAADAGDGNGVQLWTSFGEAVNTTVVSMAGGFTLKAPENAARFGNSVLLTATVNGDTSFVRSDGTLLGTYVLTSDDNAIVLGTMGGDAYFRGDIGGAAGLYKTDGTVAGTVNIALPMGVTDPRPIGTPGAVIGNTLYFTAQDGANGRQLFKTDGTAAGTKLVKRIAGGAVEDMAMTMRATVVGSKLYFVATDGNGTNLWQSDGTAAGTIMVVDAAKRNDSMPENLTAVGGYLYFSGLDAPTGREIYRLDTVARAGVGGLGWIDMNNNDRRDSFEPGIAGIVVRLWSSTGTLIDTTTTDSLGYYNFQNVPFGLYKVQFIAPSGSSPVIKDAGSDDTIDSDINPYTGFTDLFTLGSDIFRDDIDAGFRW